MGIDYNQLLDWLLDTPAHQAEEMNTRVREAVKHRENELIKTADILNQKIVQVEKVMKETELPEKDNSVSSWFKSLRESYKTEANITDPAG